MIAGSLYHGFSTMGVDNAAHIGGCIGGFFLLSCCIGKTGENEGEGSALI